MIRSLEVDESDREGGVGIGDKMWLRMKQGTCQFGLELSDGGNAERYRRR